MVAAVVTLGVSAGKGFKDLLEGNVDTMEAKLAAFMMALVLACIFGLLYVVMIIVFFFDNSYQYDYFTAQLEEAQQYSTSSEEESTDDENVSWNIDGYPGFTVSVEPDMYGDNLESDTGSSVQQTNTETVSNISNDAINDNSKFVEQVDDSEIDAYGDVLSFFKSFFAGKKSSSDGDNPDSSELLFDPAKYDPKNPMKDSYDKAISVFQSAMSNAEALATKDVKTIITTNNYDPELTIKSYESQKAAVFEELDDVNYCEMLTIMNENPDFDYRKFTVGDFQKIFEGSENLRHLYYLRVDKEQTTKGAVGRATPVQSYVYDSEGNVVVDSNGIPKTHTTYPDYNDPIIYGKVTLMRYDLDDLYTLFSTKDHQMKADDKNELYPDLTNLEYLNILEPTARRVSNYVLVSSPDGTKIVEDNTDTSKTDSLTSNFNYKVDDSFLGPYTRSQRKADWPPETEVKEKWTFFLFTKYNESFEDIKQDAASTADKVVLDMPQYVNQGDYSGYRGGDAANGSISQYACCDSSFLMVAAYYQQKAFTNEEINAFFNNSDYWQNMQFRYGYFESKFGLAGSYVSPPDVEDIKRALVDGHPVIVNIKHTGSGTDSDGNSWNSSVTDLGNHSSHFIVIIGYDDTTDNPGFYILDPGSRERSFNGGKTPLSAINTGTLISYDDFTSDVALSSWNYAVITGSGSFQGQFLTYNIDSTASVNDIRSIVKQVGKAMLANVPDKVHPYSVTTTYQITLPWYDAQNFPCCATGASLIWKYFNHSYPVNSYCGNFGVYGQNVLGDLKIMGDLHVGDLLMYGEHHTEIIAYEDDKFVYIASYGSNTGINACALNGYSSNGISKAVSIASLASMRGQAALTAVRRDPHLFDSLKDGLGSDRTYTSYANGKAIKYSDKDLEIVARMMVHEAGNQPETGQIAIAEVIYNRVVSSEFPNNVQDVVYAPSQFTNAKDLMKSAYTPSERQLKLAKQVLEGKLKVLNDPNIVFFRNPYYVHLSAAQRVNWVDGSNTYKWACYIKDHAFYYSAHYNT